MRRYRSGSLLLLFLGACGANDTAEPSRTPEASALNEATTTAEPEKRHRIDPLKAPPPAK